MPAIVPDGLGSLSQKRSRCRGGAQIEQAQLCYQLLWNDFVEC